MRAVVQRVSRVSVTSGGELLGSIGQGLMVLVGFSHGDDGDAVSWMEVQLINDGPVTILLERPARSLSEN